MASEDLFDRYIFGGEIVVADDDAVRLLELLQAVGEPKMLHRLLRVVAQTDELVRHRVVGLHIFCVGQELEGGVHDRDVVSDDGLAHIEKLLHALVLYHGALHRGPPAADAREDPLHLVIQLGSFSFCG